MSIQKVCHFFQKYTCWRPDTDDGDLASRGNIEVWILLPQGMLEKPLTPNVIDLFRKSPISLLSEKNHNLLDNHGTHQIENFLYQTFSPLLKKGAGDIEGCPCGLGTPGRELAVYMEQIRGSQRRLFNETLANQTFGVEL